MNADAEEAIKAKLSAAKDDLFRATIAARRYDAQAQWGVSGQTLQQIIDVYQAEVDRWRSAFVSL